ncbi:hypothetical protein RFI_26916 [Reticulomyxa filosa]|uniref:Viral A-type inclusion protein n=1 Tax=Reticulomyxa filosa TaxID=46433 RepID=X6M8Z3_RETFI|nr:hypothetical protein RFI_26916 [Reticulomyxa filosa]|eukprot:ETO10463.1 hypothetical protein RFI_26916 [Reticulomyxa filosa]
MAIRTQDADSVIPQRSHYGERLQPYVSYIVENYLQDGKLMTFEQLTSELPQWLIEINEGVPNDKKQLELQKQVTTLRSQLEKTEKEKEKIRRESISLQAQLQEMYVFQRGEKKKQTKNKYNFSSIGSLDEESIDEVFKSSHTVDKEEELKARIDKLELDLADERHEKEKIKEISRKSVWQLETQVKQLQSEIGQHRTSDDVKKVQKDDDNESEKQDHNSSTEVDLRDESTWTEERMEFYKNEENLMKNELYLGWKKKAEAYKEELQRQKTQMRERENSILHLIKWKEEAERLHHLEEENNQYKEQLDKLNEQLSQFQKSHEGRKMRAQSIYQLHSDVSNTLEQSKIHHEAIIEKYKEDIQALHTKLSGCEKKLDVVNREKHELLSLLTKLSEQKSFEEQMRHELLQDRDRLKNQLHTMEANKLLIVNTTSETIQSLRDNVKQLSLKLRQYQILSGEAQ